MSYIHLKLACPTSFAPIQFKQSPSLAFVKNIVPADAMVVYRFMLKIPISHQVDCVLSEKLYLAEMVQ